ncbi:endonuclease/exonuclease/phosphatase family protein [Maribacter sp. 2304DJ31-5]|uniref:endonuclease/exonuclease/phosphatase family protein n=1 Tax=Maribacter sp. 2304DJ31-5 TaxID=3386273 RepID=UPI0039BD74A9
MGKLSFFHKIVYTINAIFALFLLLACIVPYIPSASFSFLSLAVPLLVILNAIFVVYWGMVRFKLLWFSVIALVIGYFSLGSFVEFSRSREENKIEKDVKVMSFNVRGFNKRNDIARPTVFEEIKHLIDNEKPDVICFQEISFQKIKEFVDYPYRFLEHRKGKSSQGILSKFPMVKKGFLDFPETSNGGGYADIVVENDTIRIYNLHLESLRIRPGMIKREKSDRLFKRLRYSFSKQQEQVAFFRENADSCPYGKIVCGDFNNTQFSYAYRTIKGDMSDTFSEKGNGYGKTIKFWCFPLRIDFILANPNMEVLSHKNYNLRLSDHEPVMASLKLGSNK